MPLEKQYDATKVLGSATRAFWTRGYEGTSINDLVSATGLNRGSLYAAFDGKRGLFLDCLAHYDGIHRRGFLDGLAQGCAPRDVILHAFEMAARPTQETGLPPGCLLVNTALEVSPHDPEIRAIVNECLAGVEAFFAENLCKAQANGTVSKTIPVQETAKSFLGLFLALRVLARSGMENGATAAVINQARAMLN